MHNPPYRLVPVVKGTVWARHAARFTMSGQKLPTQLYMTEEEIKPGLAKRIWRYAKTRLEESGFNAAIEWPAEVETIDHDMPASSRGYSVWFENQAGGKIGVQGIMLSQYGWPFLDHGLFIEQGD